ncbi:MAG: type 1 glutamine amidotransferase-like domain-containing protein [Candidatus Peribacteraceae bacterium]|nr:type 1 glutamine amidotransferase-like domain-containing protein [Candidatus Peribacteraceae bacterium]
MQLILAGGGTPEQSMKVDQFFAGHLSGKKMLFIPHAISPKLWSYEKAFEWIQKSKAFGGLEIVMWKDLQGKTEQDMKEFDALYLMGGNTFELLHQLRTSGILELIRKFLENGKIVYGISAGAYVLGKDIQDRIPPEDEDKNAIGLEDLSALNLLKNYNVHCHYIPQHEEALMDFEEKSNIPLLAIPEESGIFVNGDKCLSLGTEPVFIFKKNVQKVEIAPNTEFSLRD